MSNGTSSITEPIYGGYIFRKADNHWWAMGTMTKGTLNVDLCEDEATFIGDLHLNANRNITHADNVTDEYYASIVLRHNTLTVPDFSRFTRRMEDKVIFGLRTTVTMVDLDLEVPTMESDEYATLTGGSFSGKLTDKPAKPGPLTEAQRNEQFILSL